MVVCGPVCDSVDYVYRLIPYVYVPVYRSPVTFGYYSPLRYCTLHTFGCGGFMDVTLRYVGVYVHTLHGGLFPIYPHVTLICWIIFTLRCYWGRLRLLLRPDLVNVDSLVIMPVCVRVGCVPGYVVPTFTVGYIYGCCYALYTHYTDTVTVARSSRFGLHVTFCVLTRCV